MKIGKIEIIERVASANTRSFSELVNIAQLDPKRDFTNQDLRNSVFKDEDLTLFDFSGSDLSGSKFIRTTIPDESFRNARLIDFSSLDIEKILNTDVSYIELIQRAMLSKTYTERGGYTIGYAAQRPDQATKKILDYQYKREKSMYVRSIIERATHCLTENINDKLKSITIFKENANSSYPLDRQRLHNTLDKATRIAPELRSYWSRPGR